MLTDKPKRNNALRRQAERLLISKGEDIKKMSTEDIEKTVHELHIYEIELEMQNEELRKAQQEIEESRSRYADLYDFAPAGYFTFDKRGLIREVNLTGSNMLSVERSLLMHKPFSAFLSSDDRDIFHRHLKRVFETQTRQTCEVKLQRKDGAVLVVQLQSMATEGGASPAVHCRTSAVDIADRKQAEQKIQQISEEWTKTFNSITDLVSIHDKDFRIVRVNKAFSEAFKMEPGEIVGKKCFEVVHGTNEPWTNCPHQRSLEKKEAVTEEFWEPHLGIYLQATTSPIFNDKNEIIGTVHIAKDITERKQMQDALQKAHGELEQRVQERTAELLSTNEQLAKEIATRKQNVEFLRDLVALNRTILTSLNDHIAILDRNGTILAVNDAWNQFARKNGDSPSTSIGMGVNYLDVCMRSVQGGDSTAQEALDGIQSVLEGSRETFTLEYPCHAPSEQRWFLMIVVPLKRPEGGVVISHKIITERKTMEESLRTSEEKFREFFKNTPDYCYIISPEGTILNINHSALQTLGYERDEIIGKPLAMIYAPESVPKMKDLFAKWKENGQVINEEIIIITRHGEKRTVLLNVGAVRDKDGTILYSTSVQTDISERKQVEEALSESQARIVALVENTSDMIWSVDVKQFGLLTFNAALRNYFFRGRGLEIHLGMTPDDMLPPDYAAQWREFYTRALREGAFVAEYHTSAKSHVLLLSFNLLKRGGEVFGVSVFGKDITDRKRAEEDLRLSEERFRQVAESVSDFVWEVDANGLYTYTSPAVEKILGYTPDELVGKLHFYDLFTPDTKEQLKSDAFNVFTAKQAFRSFPNANLSKDGRIVHLETSGVPMLDSGGNLIGYRGSDADVTEREKAGEALQQAFSEIKQLKERLEAENIYLREDINKVHNFDEIIGQSDGLRYVLYRVEQVAGTDATVLVLGETGTGKEVIAHAIHGRSLRKDRPMVTVNCAALPANLIESELFGRERGAFTGAHARQMGRFEVADKGTFFLDEIGELPLELQSKLLRVIQDGEFERLGSPHTIKVNVRIIASTSRDLREEIKKGRFREDLYYRLNVFPITIPPLRKRSDDIPLLVDHFAKKFSHKMGKEIKTIPRELMKALQDYSWPGNVRELEHIVERAVITTQDSVLRLAEKIDKISDRDRTGDTLNIVDVEREHILKVLEQTKWRIEGKEGTASLLGLNPSTLRSRMLKLGISRQVQKSSPK